MEQTLFTQFLLQFGKSSPLFLLIFLGFALSRWFGFNKIASTVLSRFAFNIALPAMLFRLLSNLALTESHADLRLLIAFFGACFILFFIGRFVWFRTLRANRPRQPKYLSKKFRHILISVTEKNVFKWKEEGASWLLDLNAAHDWYGAKHGKGKSVLRHRRRICLTEKWKH